MKKRIFAAFLSAICVFQSIFFFSGCGRQAYRDMSLEELEPAVFSNATGLRVSEYYTADADYLEYELSVPTDVEARVYLTTVSGSPNNDIIGLFKTDTDKAYDLSQNLLKEWQSILDARTEMARMYNPDEVGTMKPLTARVIGPYVVVAITEDSVFDAIVHEIEFLVIVKE